MKIRIPEKWKNKLKLWSRLIFNWRFLICFGIGWIITNGWSYAMLGLGLLTNTTWMKVVSGAYLTFLWLPISPEKIVTVAIALFLVKHLFPKHNRELREKILEASAQDEKPKKPEKAKKKKKEREHT